MIEDKDTSIVSQLERIANLLDTKGKKNFKIMEKNSVKKIYLGALVIWAMIIIAMGLYNSSFLGWFALSFPVVAFVINYRTAVNDEVNADQESIRANILTFVFISAGIFAAWRNPKRKFRVNNGKYLSIIILALMLLLFTLLDLWVTKCDLILQMHFNTVLHTMSLSLLAYAVVEYYVDNYR